MLPMEPRAGCYCCVKPPSVSSSMDIDSALNELGMLSSVTESRRQFMHERERYLQRRVSRERYVSEPTDNQTNGACAGSEYATISENLATSLQTPSNSPSKGSTYQIVQLNKQYVTGVSTCSPTKGDSDFQEPVRMELPTTSSAQTWLDFGQKYSSDTVSQETKVGRLAKSKLASRVRRFKKPYDLPWRHSIESYYFDHSASSTATSSSTISSGFMCTPDKSRPADKVACSSNSSTPEKCQTAPQGSTVPRSKSLDDLDFAKLRLAEAENHNLILEKREIDRVSQHLKDLHVGE